MKVGTACPAFFSAVTAEISKGLCHGDGSCVVGRQKHLQAFEKNLKKRFEVKETGHVGFFASDAKELKILNRTIRVDVLKDEMTLEADTKFVQETLSPGS